MRGHRTVRLLDELGVASEADHATIEVYAVQYVRWAEAAARISEQGAVVSTPYGDKPSPWISVEAKALDSMRRAAASLGLTPSARSGLKANNSGRKSDGNDTRDAILRKIDGGG